MLNHVIIYPLPCVRFSSWKVTWCVKTNSGDVNRGLGSRWLELACLVGGLLDLWPPHGSALLQSLVCCHFNQTITPSKLTHTSFWWIVDTLGHSIFAGEASYVRVGGALPRWRPPPHSCLPQARVLFKSLLWVHEIKGFHHSLALTHCRFDSGCRFINFWYKRMALPPSFLMEILGMNTLPKLL